MDGTAEQPDGEHGRRGRRATGRVVPVAVATVLAIGSWALLDRPGGPPADVERVWVFAGRGFGHGVGMSQWGARGAALRGLDAERILGTYYPGTAVETRPTRRVRVLLRDGAERVALGADGGLVAVPDGAVARATALDRADLTRDGATITVRDGSGTVRITGAVSIAFGAPGTVEVDGAPYRGTVTVRARGEGLRIVNEVGIEDYLRAVVAKEMSPAWGDDAPEALRAQAIAARTYALATLAGGGDFDLYDDQRSQVYGGAAAEDPRSDAAVRTTRGRVVTWNGDIAITYYSASSGGRTERGDLVFPAQRPRPWLVSVDDPDDAIAPLHRWPEPPTFSDAQLTEALGTILPVARITPVRTGDSPRVLEAEIRLRPFPAVRVSGARLRSRLGLPDTWFAIVMRERRPDGRPIPPPADAPPADVWVAVLNGGGVAGAAAAAAGRLEDAGYRAVHAANAPRTTGPSVVYHAPGAEAAAAGVADALDVTEIRPVSAAPAGRLAAAPAGVHVTVVLGRG